MAWPWEFRYRRGWAPRYRYRQVAYVEAGWGRHRRDARLDIRTTYHHRVRYATPLRAEVDIFIDRIELYEDGRFLGAVHHIPPDLGRIEAVLYRDGRVRFDRTLFLLGDPHAGFELISTRAYDRYVLDAYHRSHGLRAGMLDLFRGRIFQIPYSRLFDPFDFNGYVPISLLPDDPAWLYDYGYGAVSAYGFEDYWGADGYRYDGYYDDYDPGYTAPHRAAPTPERGTVRSQPDRRAGTPQPLQRQDEAQHRTERGATIRLKREMELQRIE